VQRQGSLGEGQIVEGHPSPFSLCCLEEKETSEKKKKKERKRKGKITRKGREREKREGEEKTRERARTVFSFSKAVHDIEAVMNELKIVDEPEYMPLKEDCLAMVAGMKMAQQNYAVDITLPSTYTFHTYTYITHIHTSHITHHTTTQHTSHHHTPPHTPHTNTHTYTHTTTCKNTHKHTHTHTHTHTQHAQQTRTTHAQHIYSKTNTNE